MAKFVVRQNRTRPSRLLLQGDVGIAAAADMHRALLDLQGSGVEVTVDCKKASHLDGAIIQLLLVAQRSWPGGGDRFRLINTSRELRAHLMRTGVSALVPA